MSLTKELLEQHMGFMQPLDGHPVLQNHPTQSAAPIIGWKSILFGSPFLASGIFIEFVARGDIHGKKNAPNWLIALVGSFFLLGGIFFIVHGIHDLIRQEIWKREASAHPGEPWAYDFHWHREGISYSAFGEMVQRLMGALFWNAFLIPFFWVGSVGGAWPFLIGAGLLGLVGLIFWYRWGVMVLDLLRYGNSYLRYDEFPYFLGSSLRARLRPPRHLSAIDELTMVLRCVEEKYITSGTGENRSTKVVCYEIYRDVVTINRDRLTGLAGNDIPVEFRLPADQPTTVLADRPPTYWEIQAKGKARGADYEAIFLVPVYKNS